MARMLAVCLLACLATAVNAAERDDDVVILISGERLEGVVIDEDDETVVLRHHLLGRLNIDRENIEEMHLYSPADPPEDPEEDPEEDAEPPDPDEERRPADGEEPLPTPPEPPIEWDSRLELSLNLREGRSTTRDGRVTWESGFSTEKQTFRYDTSYRIRADRSNRTEQRFTIGTFWERPRISTPWSVFAQGRYEYDEFNAWDQRVTASGGFGYQLLTRDDVDEDGNEFERWNVKLRGGLGGRREFGSDDEDLNPEGLIGGELVYRLSPRQRFNAVSTYFQTLDEKEDFRIVTNAEYEVDIDQLNGMSLKLGLAHEHQAQTPANVRRDDLSIFAALVLNF